MTSINRSNVKIIQDADQAISVMHKAGQWMQSSGKNPSKWWQPENMNRNFLLQHIEPEEFYAALVDGKPVASEVLQWDQRNQDWSSVDRGQIQQALYIHWLCVDPEYAKMGLPQIMVNFAAETALKNEVPLLRVDTNAAEMNLRKIYERVGFQLVATQKEIYRTTAFYQKKLG